jgi:hypothetical protein
LTLRQASFLAAQLQHLSKHLLPQKIGISSHGSVAFALDAARLGA